MLFTSECPEREQWLTTAVWMLSETANSSEGSTHGQHVGTVLD